MKVVDMNNLEVAVYAQREKNVIHKGNRFKVRAIELGANGQIPECDMRENVIFLMLSGDAEVTVNGTPIVVGPGHCLITEPAKVSMRSRSGARMLGIQIEE